MARHIAVIGSGVTGISSAILLQRAGHRVTIIARDFPAPFETINAISQINYTSPWGGAHNRWVPPHPSNPQSAFEHPLSITTFSHMKSLYSFCPQTAGITFLKGIEYLEAPGPEYQSLTTAKAAELSLPGFRLLSPSEFPDSKVTWGCEYETYCVNPMVYLSFLLRRFVHRGGRILKHIIRSPAEAFSLSARSTPSLANGAVDAVVNASGIGFGDDPAMFITRGQTVLVAEECDATVTRQNADGSWTFCVPRGFEGGTVIGGTKEMDDWESAPRPETREKLLKAFAGTHPKILAGKDRLTVIADIVGRRPSRKGGPRIEGELLDLVGANGKGFVMHAYGLGGRGYELSWGVAERVVEGVEGYFKGVRRESRM
ncbi:putative D-amino-acid oxidase [Triangularia setosa]|uniref:D-amino-acid oxidase n=1 Tax=Triangularia setosa TaxID=2587417 RepID=A0AAN6WJW6_9PEZI|nr:putative D-amino-acid oxidase [Podospora setosa]